jgi:hypothetical protein
MISCGGKKKVRNGGVFTKEATAPSHGVRRLPRREHPPPGLRRLPIWGRTTFGADEGGLAFRIETALPSVQVILTAEVGPSTAARVDLVIRNVG